MLIRLWRTMLVLGMLVPINCLAAQAGFRSITVPGADAGSESIPIALFYPTQAPERSIAMGPFTAHVAMRASPDARIKGLIVLSHGTGGTELGQNSLAEALARDGYLVAALRHPGDNWQDSSLLSKSPTRFFTERPQQASHVIDAVLQDPEWKDRIAKDEKGPIVGAVGHSAGGYTVLALAGGKPDLGLIRAHCDAHRAEDPIFCGMGRTREPGAAASTAQPIPAISDARVRAVVALSPVGVVFTTSSLSGIAVPTLIYEPELDRFLVPRFHAERVARDVPGAQLRRVPNAWHFAFMDSPSMPIETPDGDIRANPPGFDRQAFLKQIGEEVPAFFDRVFRH
ncbi:MAG: dienelactone hydrolase [Variovorax sp.]|nr:dienelactone hydrolase [Variovorax sp.]